VFGSVSGAFGYRRELQGQQQRATVLGAGSLFGGLTGAVLLLTLPSSVFDDVVPVLILVACGLVIAQPRLSAVIAARRTKVVEHGGLALWILVLLTGIYGGYFGAAQGVILLAVLRLAFEDDLQRLNAVKNVLAGLVNLVAAIIFVAVSHVAWGAALCIAVGSTLGGHFGGTYGRRLSPTVLRGFIVVVGTIAAVRLIVT